MSDKHMIISIGRQCGSGGHEIGEKLAARYGLKLYDRNIIELLAEQTNSSPEDIARLEEKRENVLGSRKGGFAAKEKDLMKRFSKSDELFRRERALIQSIAEKESFVIVGRGANAILEDNPDILRLFVYAPEEFRIARAKEDYRLEFDSEAKKKIESTDRARQQYFEYYTGKTWGANDHHNLSIDSSLLGIDGTVELLAYVIDKRFGL